MNRMLNHQKNQKRASGYPTDILTYSMSGTRCGIAPTLPRRGETLPPCCYFVGEGGRWGAVSQSPVKALL